MNRATWLKRTLAALATSTIAPLRALPLRGDFTFADLTVGPMPTTVYLRQTPALHALFGLVQPGKTAHYTAPFAARRVPIIIDTDSAFISIRALDWRLHQ